MKRNGLILILILMLATSCSEYQQLLKSTDPELKYNKAVEYFDKKDYVRAQTLFEDISTYYKGTERSEDVLNYLARCFVGQNLYESATDYYSAYIRNYPKGQYIVEARFMIGHCYYLDSPDARLDQEKTNKAIQYLTEFIEMFPESPYITDAYSELEEMYNKLAYKEYLSAKLYYNLGTYLGNNYESANIVAQNALKKYPGNAYVEELSWIILQSKYEQVKNSFESKKQERARDTYDEYYNFLTEFPDTKHKKAADKIGTELKKIIKD